MQENTTAIPKNNRKIINAWCSYDIANSSYNLSIGTAIYPVYYQAITSKNISFWGASFANTVLYDYAIAAGYLVIIFLTPLLSGIADFGGYRKRFMQMFTILGSLSCMGLYFYTGQNVSLGVILPALAVIGYAGSLVYYNSFLPIIASPTLHDKISARGFIFGYAGSMLLLIFNLFSITNYEWFGFSNVGNASRAAFLMVGIWWFAIGQIAVYYLKEYPAKIKINPGIFINGFREILSVSKQLRHMPEMGGFLLAFFFLSTGVQTIILVASQFGSSVLGLSSNELIAIVLVIQVVAILGSWVFGRVSMAKGNKFSLLVMLFIWTLICISAYFVTTETQFFILAAMVGMVMGGIQSQSRSSFSKLIPANSINTASFFTFYDITEKLAIVIGMFGFGFVHHITGSMRNSALMLSVFFILSFIILSFFKLSTNKKSQ